MVGTDKADGINKSVNICLIRFICCESIFFHAVVSENLIAKIFQNAKQV